MPHSKKEREMSRKLAASPFIYFGAKLHSFDFHLIELEFKLNIYIKYLNFFPYFC